MSNNRTRKNKKRKIEPFTVSPAHTETVRYNFVERCNLFIEGRRENSRFSVNAFGDGKYFVRTITQITLYLKYSHAIIGRISVVCKQQNEKNSL